MSLSMLIDIVHAGKKTEGMNRMTCPIGMKSLSFQMRYLSPSSLLELFCGQ